MNSNKVLKNSSAILFIPRNKTTGEFIDEDGNTTFSVSDAAGYKDYATADEKLGEFDEPDDWYIVMKLININIIGEPIEVKSYI